MENDTIGDWSELKLEIIRDYAKEYSRIMARQNVIQRYIYIDAFAGSGVHISRATGEPVLGSPLNALSIKPPFSEYHFIDADPARAAQLRDITKDQPNVSVYDGDCNVVLRDRVLQRAKYEDYARALCLIDPYNIDLSWEVVSLVGKMKSVEILLNFMIMDMNMNILRHNPDNVPQRQINRMNRFWGDESWREVVYDSSGNLFNLDEKVAGNEAMALAYRNRLKDVAGFAYVPDPLPMRNSKGATVYYLYFASPNATGKRIIEYIFQKYRNRR